MLRRVMVLVVLAAAGVGGWMWWQHSGRGAAPAEASRHSARSDRPVPVTVVPVARKDVPLYLDGLGTVQAYKTVTVHSRIDGQLVSVNFKEGQDVHAGDILAHVDDRVPRAQWEQAQATRDKDVAQLESARRDLARYLGLGNRVAGQTVDQQRALVKQLEATVRADEAAVDNARAQLSYTVIAAPIDGRTGLRLVDEGNIVHVSDSGGLVVLTQVQPIAVIFTLPQQSLSRIDQQAVQEGRLPVLAVQADNKTIVDQGHLELVDNQIDSTTGTIRLKAVMPNEGHRLWPGGFVNVRLLVDTALGGLVIPATAVQRGPQGTYAFVVGPDRTVEMRPIKVTQIEADEALVAEGLAEGDKVVADGAGKLQAGSKVAFAGEAAPPK